MRSSDDDDRYIDIPDPSTKRRARGLTNEEEERRRKENHKKCEWRRRERINHNYDELQNQLARTSFVKTKKNVKLDRCSLIRYTHNYMKELQYNVEVVARLLCKIATTKPELKPLFQRDVLQFILNSEYIDDDVCLLLAACFDQPYILKCCIKNSYVTRKMGRYSSRRMYFVFLNNSLLPVICKTIKCRSNYE